MLIPCRDEPSLLGNLTDGIITSLTVTECDVKAS